LVVVGCPQPTDDPSGDGEKYLTVTGGAFLFSSSAKTGVYPTGTSMVDAAIQTGVVAGLDTSLAIPSDGKVEGSNLKIKLYLPPNTSTRWYGSGTYDVIAIVGGATVYRATNVKFSGGAGTCAIGSSTSW
jgi:hypothetical protein